MRVTRTLELEVEFDDELTDVDSVSDALDRLLETAESTPGIWDDYDPEISIGIFIPKDE